MPLPVDALRCVVSAAVVSLRGHGEPVSDLCHAHIAGRRQVLGGRDCPRNCTQLDRKLGDESYLGAFLAE